MQRQKRIRQRNPWKIAFLTLVSLLILTWGIPTLFFRNHLSAPTQTVQNTTNPNDSTLADVTLSKEMVQTLLNQATANYTAQGMSPVQFEINDSVVQITGNTTILGFSVPFTLATVPYVTEDGDIQLKIESIQVSGIAVPIGTVLSSFNQQDALPQWLSIDQENQLFTVNVRNFHEGTTIIAKKIDLKSNEFVFSVSISNDNIVKYLQ